MLSLLVTFHHTCMVIMSLNPYDSNNLITICLFDRNGSVNASFEVHFTLKNAPKDQLNKDFNDTVRGMVDRLQAANQSQHYCQQQGNVLQ